MINTGKNRHIQMWTTYEKITYNTEIAKISHFSVFLSILGSNQYKVLSLGLMTNNPRHSSITDLNIQNYPHNNLFDLIYQSFIPIIKKTHNLFIHSILNCLALVYEIHVMLMLSKLTKKKIHGTINLTVSNHGQYVQSSTPPLERAMWTLDHDLRQCINFLIKILLHYSQSPLKKRGSFWILLLPL